ncbi:single-stranded DNA-binding protein [Taibaiella chishuiensis]|uniref:Single-stranded DNA-binding protein n=1 Tax=Taibaiella chishuiensis TaxID=1434707 RepID=A0A2P8CT57_9BACT|nr:single-stranded DNA-binding protein [Taibaiella chishuiensis]PSK88156.1 single-strand binding protein [Taibaiella chishuiensis]
MSTLKNRVQLMGHLGADPELKTIDSGARVARLRIATNESYKTASGDWKDETMWHSVTAWEKLAERIEQRLHKGSFVMVEGKLVNRTFTDANGMKKYYTEVRANNIMLLDKKQAEQGEPAANESAPAMAEGDDGLPF